MINDKDSYEYKEVNICFKIKWLNILDNFSK